MHRHTALLWVGLGLGIALTPSRAAADSPTVYTAVPRGGKRGTEVTLNLYGRNLKGAQQLMLFRQGLEVLKLEVVKPTQVRARVRIAADCPLGEHPMRVRTDRGISNLRSFWVGTLAEVAEKEPNNGRETAQKVGLDVTVNGRVTPEDVDVFAFDVPAPMRLNFEVQGVRLGDREFDPHLAIYDAAGKPLAEVDDTPFGRMDPWCSVEFAAKGTYYAEVRESAFGGNNGAFYRLSLGRYPRPIGVMPPGGRPGETLKVTYIGDGAGREVEVTLPEDGARGHAHFPTNEHGSAPTPVVLSVRDLANVIEPKDNKSVVKFTPPVAINGVISQPGQYDRWRFAAKKGQRLEILMLARRLRSPIDPVISMREVKGKFRGYNDDNRHPDSRIDFRCPADGEYEIVVYDHLRRGGPDYFYRVEVAPAAGNLTTSVTRPGRFRGDETPIAVPSGGRMAALISTRGVAAGGLLDFPQLPPGVTATVGPLVSGTNLVPVVFAAAPKAALAGSLTPIRVQQPKQKDFIDANLQQYVPVVRVRNNQPYVYTVTDRAPVAVIAESPFAVEVTPPKVPLVRGSPLYLDVKIKRAAKFNAAIRISPVWSPPGVGIGSITIPAGKDAGRVPMNAAGNAALRSWKIALLGTVARNNGKLEASSELFDLQVVAPWMTASLGKARAESGQKTELVVKLNKVSDFEGAAKAQLLGLPGGVKTVTPEVSRDTKELRFPLEIAADARPGRTRNLLLRLHMPSSSGTVLHDYRGGELRVDKPLPPKKKAAPKPAKPVAKKKTAKPGQTGTLAKPKT